jgi:hypothetical protein
VLRSAAAEAEAAIQARVSAALAALPAPEIDAYGVLPTLRRGRGGGHGGRIGDRDRRLVRLFAMHQKLAELSGETEGEAGRQKSGEGLIKLEALHQRGRPWQATNQDAPDRGAGFSYSRSAVSRNPRRLAR